MTENRNQRLRRARALLAVAVVAFVLGALAGAGHGGSPEGAVAQQFVEDWAHDEYASMYALLTPSSRRAISVDAFAAAYRRALTVATASGARVDGRPRGESGGYVVVPVRVSTRLFGTLDETFMLHVDSAEGAARVAWSRWEAFPGLRPGELLTRRTTMPRRAAILARDGTVLAEATPGPAEGLDGEQTRGSPLGNLATAVVGSVGPIPAGRRQALEEKGLPADATVGLDGLELALDELVRGTPGGELLAGTRVLAYVAPRASAPVRTSISPTVQRAAVTALGGQLGGVVALDPTTGQVLAVAGIALDGLQPPGSTFKMVTVTGVLSAKIATPQTVFPYATYATLDGVKLSNANGEECGGTLELAFAVSCNSVFSPLGVKLGAARLVATAERLGFNHAPGIPGASESTLPAAADIQGELDVGSTAIGQGEVLATPLEMATVAATVADGGHRPRPTFSAYAGASNGPVAMSEAVAHTVRKLMIGVVREGTGTAAAIPGVTVAGKTGTAELKDACSSTGGETQEASKEGCSGESEAANTDAWFAAFAPALNPRIAVCVLLVKDGAGGATAAPVAREVLEAALP